MSDLFKSGTDLANAGVLTLLGIAVIALAYVAYKAYKREISRADLALAGWQNATTQFEKALELIKQMQSRRRTGDETN